MPALQKVIQPASRNAVVWAAGSVRTLPREIRTHSLFFGARTNVITRGEVGPKSTVPVLCGQLKDGDGWWKKKAAEALGTIGDARAVEPLCAALKDWDSYACRAAAAALVKIGQPAVSALYGLLEKRDGDVLLAAARALGEFGEQFSIPPLCVALKEDKWEAFVTAAKAGDPSSVQILCAVLKGGWRDERQHAAMTLQNIGQPAVESLCAALDDKDSDVCQKAATALGVIGDARAVERLCNMAIYHRDSDVPRRSRGVRKNR